MKLIDYVLSHNRRLVSPVGGGSAKRFNDQIDTSNMTPEDKIAQWLYFQTKEYGHDFVISSIPYIDICNYFGLKTYIDSHKTEHVCLGQINSTNDLKKISKSKSFKAFMTNPYIKSIKKFKKLSTTAIGLGGFGPATLTSYVLGVKNFLIKCIKDPVFIQEVSNFFTELIIEIACEGERNGADFLWVGEPVVVMISRKHFNIFSGQYVKKIFYKTYLPGFLHVPGETNHLLDEFVQTGAQCLSLDHHVDMKKVAYTVPPNIVTLGNIDTISIAMNDVKKIKKQVIELNEKIKNFPNFIVSSGGGIIDDTPEESLRVLFDVTSRFPAYNKEQYHQISDLWRIIAANDWDLFNNYISENNVTNKIINVCSDEACEYLNFQLENNKIDLETYNKMIKKIGGSNAKYIPV
ncbi:uroporphyrinogen decarboxylase family protein [Desulfosarcina ovata]|uniref:Uroporphyrinogen decarboxylase n=1 Tax=Desulfosarcina ovata subsp. ovata TaxID=2752305 RepID=A0A5K8A7H3_9BACT|nr:uroporphyrinogen decarboxylase family protein [Desulfosarcina ovata]BBO88475.1 uroporphyrinogen decarboxylase [Desulfosarcina ovata subsp. ovata]